MILLKEPDRLFERRRCLIAAGGGRPSLPEHEANAEKFYEPTVLSRGRAKFCDVSVG